MIDGGELDWRALVSTSLAFHGATIGCQVMSLSDVVPTRLVDHVGVGPPEVPEFSALKVRPLGFPVIGWTIAPAAYGVNGFQSAPGLLIVGTPVRKLSD